MKTTKIGLMFVIGMFLVSCGPIRDTTDQVQQQQQEQIIKEANAQAGMPNITNFTQKKLVKSLYELLDKNIATFTYKSDMQGRLWHVCDSIGYGLPYGVQYTNPSKLIDGASQYSYHGPMPQSEPNGLFMPPTAEGTWVMCAGKNGSVDPVYIEDRIITSPRKLASVGSYQLP